MTAPDLERLRGLYAAAGFVALTDGNEALYTKINPSRPWNGTILDATGTARAITFHETAEGAAALARLIAVATTALPDLLAIAERAARMEAALTEIAAFTDEEASRRLERDGCYAAFDEPCAVERARAALADGGRG